MRTTVRPQRTLLRHGWLLGVLLLAAGAAGCGDDDGDNGCTDSDGDGLCDGVDFCDGEDDTVDSDGDRVPDCLDPCPNDASKLDEGQCGCGNAETDTDNDGMADCADECEDDPNKTLPGSCGCGTADTDLDADGEPDCTDGCPVDANKTAPGTCGCGTADTDTDTDLTPDCNDDCPGDANKTEPGVCGCGTADGDTDGDGVHDCDDCQPMNPMAYPGAVEVCNGKDDDCNGVVDDQGACPCTVDYYGNAPYLFCNTTMPWDDAVGYCEQFGYNIVTVDDASENEWLLDNISNLTGMNPWIGLHSPTFDGEWVWESQSATSFTNWRATDPISGVPLCAGLWSYNGEWFASNCDTNRRVICEYGCTGADADSDGIADQCDPCQGDPENDADGDGVCETDDNCPTTYNPDQFDANGDGTGDECEALGCGNGIIDAGEECDDGNTTASDGCSSTCTCDDAGSGVGPGCAATSCNAILNANLDTGDTTYWIDPSGSAPYVVWCDMTLNGGGWTLVFTSSDDGEHTWTWDNRTLLTTDTTTVGSWHYPERDYKSAAYHELSFSNLLFIHQPSGEWAAYNNNVGDGSSDVGTFLGAQAFPQCEMNGVDISAGSIATGGNLCDDKLYFHRGDWEGGTNIDACWNLNRSYNNAAYGPAWNMGRNNGCPFDDVSFNGGIGPAFYPIERDTEYNSRGFGGGLGLNTGAAGHAENYIQMYVR